MFERHHLSTLQRMSYIAVVMFCCAQTAFSAPAHGEKKPFNQVLPTSEQLINAKLDALKTKTIEQEQRLAEVDLALKQELAQSKSIFNSSAVLSVSMTNIAPLDEYRLQHTDIYIDGKLFAKGGKRNLGLPRNENLYVGPIVPGCHEILVVAHFERLKKSLFKASRIEEVQAQQTFVAKNGYRVVIEIQGYEYQNTWVGAYRRPAIKFINGAKPNFLPGAALVPLDQILEQGRLRISYVTEDVSHHRLIEKSLTIDGLPVLTKEKLDKTGQESAIFNAPLNQGKHTLGVTLVFGQQKSIQGGPSYNFRLSFNRDFDMVSGQTTMINLTGMPKDGFRSSEEDTRYARATSIITATDLEDFFPKDTCEVISQKKNTSTIAAPVSRPAAEEPKEPEQSVPKGSHQTTMLVPISAMGG